MHLQATKLKGGSKNAAATRFQVAVSSAADPQIIHPMGRDNEQCAQQETTHLVTTSLETSAHSS